MRAGANAGPAPIDAVIDRIRKVQGRWNRTTTAELMRRDWDALMWSDAVAARSQRVSAHGTDAAWIDAAEGTPDTVLLYFHGGGFQVGSVKSHRDLIARLSRAAGCRALAIDYRLAPEHRYPAALQDAVAAYRWLIEQGIAPDRMAFGMVQPRARAQLTFAALGRKFTLTDWSVIPRPNPEESGAACTA